MNGRACRRVIGCILNITSSVEYDIGHMQDVLTWYLLEQNKAVRMIRIRRRVEDVTEKGSKK